MGGNLTANFNWKEFFVSADYPKLAETTWDKEKNNLLFKERILHLCTLVLQPIRWYYGKPVKILSGIRSLELNKKVGGKDNSDHTKGLATDFYIPNVNGVDILKWMANNTCHKVAIYYPDQKFIHASINWPGDNYEHEEFFKLGNEYELASKYWKKGVEL